MSARGGIVSEPTVTPELAREQGLSDDEYRRMLDIMGRTPTWTELGLFMSMWSEHCSYKSSRVHLKNLPTSGPRVVQGPGENAGIIDIGDGQVAVFKMESHNHPSFVEPYQGAATGVGGILRPPPQQRRLSSPSDSRAAPRAAWLQAALAGWGGARGGTQGPGGSGASDGGCWGGHGRRGRAKSALNFLSAFNFCNRRR